MARNAPSLAAPRFTAIAACVLAGAILGVYARTFSAPYVFDDLEAIVQNPTIRHLWPLTDVLAPPHHLGSTVGGRPLLNLTFALNYAVSGDAVWSYHLFNLLIHTGSALLLFGICRRTLRAARRFGPGALDRDRAETPAHAALGSDADLLAFAISAFWALHPLQTEAVTYLSQRAESLASFFYLLTLYAFCRAGFPQGDVTRQMPERGAGDARIEVRRSETLSIRPASTGRWLIVSAVACLLGGASKEIVATAPVVVLLYDRTFLGGTFRAAWRERRWYYVSLAASWLLVGFLVISTQNRGGTAGFGTGVSVWAYLLTQARAIVHYLGLVFWPRPLVFDYGTNLASGLAEAWPYGLVIVPLLIGAVAATLGRPSRPSVVTTGFLGLAFFILLAPSSSVVPIGSQTMAEHRMYLPLAAIAVLTGAFAYRGWRRRGVMLIMILAAAAGVLAWRRNEVYRSDLTLWSNTVAHAPDNARAHNNLGDALVSRGRFAAALPHYEQAVKLQPDYVDAQSNLGHVLVMLGRATEAVPHAEMGVKLRPQSPDVWINYGLALGHTDRLPDAIAAFEKALQLSPTALDARYDLANTYYQLRDYTTAISQYEKVLRLEPTRRDARFNLAYALLQLNRPQDALAQFEILLQQDPNDARTHVEAGNILGYFGRRADAIAHFETALRIQPNFTAAREQLEKLQRTAPTQR